MRVHSTQSSAFAVCRSNGPPETRFPGGGSTASRKPQMDTSGLETDRGLIRFDGFNSGLSLTSIAIASNVSICNCLRMLAKTVGPSPGRRSPSQKDGKFESVRYGPSQSRPGQKKPRRSTGFGHRTGHIPFVADSVQKWTRSPPDLSGRNSRRQDLAGHTRRRPLFSCWRASSQVNAGLPDRKINCLLAIGSASCGSAPTGACIAETAKTFRRVNCRRSSVSPGLSLLRDRDLNLWVVRRGATAHQRGRHFVLKK